MKTDISVADGRIQSPFVVSLPFGLAPGRYVVVSWKSLSGGRVNFNFGEGVDFNSKTVFHYSPRPNEGYVGRNVRDGDWGPEERDGSMPFTVGVTHEMKFVVRPDFYECFVNGNKHVVFKHRLSMELAKFFFVCGECEIYNISFGDEAADQAAASLKNLTMPYSTTCSIFPGRKIYFSGIPKSSNKTFWMALTLGEDLAFCFAVRMNEKLIVMNNRIGGNWIAEERVLEFPFKEGQFFIIHIEVQTDKMKVFVDDKPYAEFKHRVLPLDKITGFRIDGDIDARRIHVC